MPKEMAHWLIAGKAFNRLDQSSSIFNLIQENRNLYYVGAVLPDTPAHFISGRNKKLVHLLDREFHDPDQSSFLPAVHLLKNIDINHQAEFLALLAGTITHIITDSVFHPFVYYHCGMNDTGKHYRLETYIDLYFMSKYNENFRSMKKLLQSAEADSRIIAAFMNLYFDRDTRLRPETYKKSLRLHALIQSAWLKPLLLKTGKGISLIPGIKIDDTLELFYPPVKRTDILSRVFSFRHPVTGERKEASMEDLAEEAVLKITSIINGMIKAKTPDKMAEFLTSIEGPNPLTGLEGIKSDRMTHFSLSKNIDELIFSRK